MIARPVVPTALPAAAVHPLAPAELEAALAALGLDRAGRYAIALSGGPDSLALAYLLHQLNPQLVALIVDHGLRAESTEEAQQVKSRAEALGLLTHILHWQGPKPATGIMEEARSKRYELLLETCLQQGITHLFLGHHQDDQHETVQMRLERGSHQRGLAGMPALTRRRGITLVRPLLHTPKARLIATCAAEGLQAVDDPSNRSPKYKRAQLRTQPLPEDWQAQQQEAARARNTELERLRPLCTLQQGWATFAPEQLGDTGLLRLLLNYVGQNEYGPEELALEQVKPGRTLAGCLISAWQGKILISREPSAIAPLALEAGPHNIYWDRRWQLQLDLPEPMTLVPLDKLPWRDSGMDLAALPGPVRRSLPALVRKSEGVVLPQGVYSPYFEPFYQKFW